MTTKVQPKRNEPQKKITTTTTTFQVSDIKDLTFVSSNGVKYKLISTVYNNGTYLLTEVT